MEVKRKNFLKNGPDWSTKYKMEKSGWTLQKKVAFGFKVFVAPAADIFGADLMERLKLSIVPSSEKVMIRLEGTIMFLQSPKKK